MGWFDNDPKTNAQETASPASPARNRTATAKPPLQAGSSLGARVHVNGTIVSDENLKILGKVEGTIHARQTLLIAKEAEVKAVIHGRRVQVDGTVVGDIHGAETVVLGTTASLHGNIHTPSLQILEGAFFKGSVEMKSAQPAAAKAQPAQAAKPPAAKAAAAGASKPASSSQAGAAAKPASAGHESPEVKADATGAATARPGAGGQPEGRRQASDAKPTNHATARKS